MSSLRIIIESFWRWMDSAAAGVLLVLDSVKAARKVRITEASDGTFVLEGAKNARIKIVGGSATCPPEAADLLKGSRVEIAMRPERFFFRAIELPKRATEFIGGVVRAQIDRITPWSASEAMFGWSIPSDIAAERISVTVAATSRAQVAPLMQAMGELGPKSIALATRLPEDLPNRGETIRVFEESTTGALELRQVRRTLAIVFACMVLLAVGAAAAASFIVDDLNNRQADIARQISQRRGLLRAGNEAISNSAIANLARLKNQTPATVIVLEALSKALPDHTYVTELRIEGDKVPVGGISRDAPSLIRLIEQSPHFDRATFFAPTTRSPSDPGDRFHIEARIKPVFTPPS